jgi:hypothetical protein
MAYNNTSDPRVQYAKRTCDNIEWIEKDEKTAIRKFLAEESQLVSSTSLLLKFPATRNTVALADLLPSEEYDVALETFVPYKPYVYVILDEKRQIVISTKEKPHPSISGQYRTMQRHMADHYILTHTAVPHFDATPVV